MSDLQHNFGTDPEFFIYKDMIPFDDQLIPYIIPPEALIEDHDYKFEEKDFKKIFFCNNNFQWSADGAAIELQINPSNSTRSFVDNFRKAFQYLVDKLSPNFNVSKDIIGYFDIDKYWKNRDENFRSCVIFGCDPDMYPKIYKSLGLESENKLGILDASNHSYRYAGAHIHIQAPKFNPEIYYTSYEKLAIVFDAFAGLYNTSIYRSNKHLIQEKARLKYYGKPGRVRLQEYKNNFNGIEYRVMSNFFLRSDLDTISLLKLLDLCALMAEHNDLEDFISEHTNIIPEMYSTIMKCDRKSAHNLLLKFLNWAVVKKYCGIDFVEHIVGGLI